ncbi:MAG: transposase [Pseudonocardiales bacterium]
MPTMPKPYPREFRENVVAVARQGQEGIAQIAKDFGIAESCLRNWLNAADVDDGKRGGPKVLESEQLRELKRRNRLLEQENDSKRRSGCQRP